MQPAVAPGRLFLSAGEERQRQALSGPVRHALQRWRVASSSPLSPASRRKPSSVLFILTTKIYLCTIGRAAC